MVDVLVVRRYKPRRPPLLVFFLRRAHPNIHFDILLLSGYFRIRIPSINSFDKIVGGLSWCISCSNFDIDIEYNEEMNLG